MISLPVTEFGLTFRFVEESDAAFILSLRTDPWLSRYLSPTDVELTKQLAWIQRYKEREALGQEYYLLYTDENGNRLGVFRLYHMTTDTVTSGSWLSRPGGDEMNAFKADLFLTKMIFEGLKFKKCLIDVRKENKKLVRYHQLFFKKVREDDQDIYMSMDQENYQRKCQFLKSILSFK